MRVGRTVRHGTVSAGLNRSHLQCPHQLQLLPCDVLLAFGTSNAVSGGSKRAMKCKNVGTKMRGTA